MCTYLPQPLASAAGFALPCLAAFPKRDGGNAEGDERVEPPGPEGGVGEQADQPGRQRYTIKPYPKNDQRRTLKIGAELTGLLTDRIAALGLQDDDLLFPSTERNLQQPTSRNTFRTKVWRPPSWSSASLPPSGCTT